LVNITGVAAEDGTARIAAPLGVGFGLPFRRALGKTLMPHAQRALWHALQA
jgi:hypothetical protein